MSPTSLQVATGLAKSRFIKSGLAGASSSGIAVLFLDFGAIPRVPSSFMHFITRYSVVPANSSGRNASANLAPKVRPDSSHTRFTSALSPAHGSSGSPLASQLQKPDLDTSSTLAIIFTG